MTLQHALRHMLDVRGSAVLNTADEFRSALDDFLTEEEAPVGVLNLLVDAVRTGAVARFRSLIDAGATTRAAVDEAGIALARDRASREVQRARWALVVIAYALAQADDRDVALYEATLEADEPQSNSTSAPPHGARPPSPALPAQSSSQPATEAALTRTNAPLVANARTNRKQRVGKWSFVVVALAVLGAAGIAATYELATQDDTAAPGPSSTAAPRHSKEPVPTPSPRRNATRPTASPSEVDARALPDVSFLFTEYDGYDSHIASLDTASGAITDWTTGPFDELPTISPDRTSAIYLQRTSAGEGRRPQALDFTTGESRALFRPTSPCAYANRPGYTADGTMIALVCTDSDRVELGLYVAQADGSSPRLVTTEPGLVGSPTWTSDRNIVITVRGPAPTYSEHLVAVDTRTGSVTPVTDGRDGWDSHPDYSPQTHTLLFLRSNEPDAASRAAEGDDYGEIWTVRRGRQVAVGPEFPVGHPVWAPDGTAVAFTIDEGAVYHIATAPWPTLSPVQEWPIECSIEGQCVAAWGSR